MNKQQAIEYGCTHWGWVAGCKTYFVIKDGHVTYMGKPWNHASVMKFYKIN